MEYCAECCIKGPCRPPDQNIWAWEGVVTTGIVSMRCSNEIQQRERAGFLKWPMGCFMGSLLLHQGGSGAQGHIIFVDFSCHCIHCNESHDGGSSHKSIWLKHLRATMLSFGMTDEVVSFKGHERLGSLAWWPPRSSPPVRHVHSSVFSWGYAQRLSTQGSL